MKTIDDRIIATSAAGPLLAGLDWRPPASGVPSRAALKEALSLAEARYYVELSAGERTVYGLLPPTGLDDVATAPKGALAAAALFSQAVGESHPNAALLLTLEPLDERESRRLLVVLEDGLPSIDMLGDDEGVLRALADEQRPMWADDRVAYPHAQVASLDWLCEAATPAAAKLAQLRKQPLNPMPVLIAVASAAVLIGGGLAWQNHQRVKAQELAAQRAAEADPIPKYQAALAQQAPSAGFEGQDLARVLADLYQLPVQVPGWSLQQIDCDAAQSACQAKWVREGGGFDELRAALPKHEVVLDGAEGATPSLATATSRWAIKVARRALEASLPTLNDALSKDGPQLQGWLTAELALDLKAPALWPAPPEVPVTLAGKGFVRRGEISVKGAPADFAGEILLQAPRWVTWESVHMDVSPQSAPKGRLSLSLSGHYYVEAS